MPLKKTRRLLALIIVTVLIGIIAFSPLTPRFPAPSSLVVNTSNPLSSSVQFPSTSNGDVLSYTHSPHSGWSKYPQKGIPILMYHSIKDLPGNTLGVPPQQFREEIQWLAQQEYTPISLEQYYRALTYDAALPPKPIVLTFDDGYVDNFLTAWPILKAVHYQATFFIITSSIGSNMMSWDQLRELSQNGNPIESHTVHHYDLSTLSFEQQLKELTDAKIDIETHIGKPVTTLCFPSGRFNSNTLKAMERAGYSIGVTTQPGIAQKGDSTLTLKRVRISGGLSLTQFKKMFP